MPLIYSLLNVGRQICTDMYAFELNVDLTTGQALCLIKAQTFTPRQTCPRLLNNRACPRHTFSTLRFPGRY